MSDPKTRRSVEFWSQLGPVVGQYVFTHFHQKYWVEATDAARAEAFENLHEKVLGDILVFCGVDARSMVSS